MPAFAEVAVPLPVFATYSYRVPSEWREGVRPGVRVQVPFGRGRVVGLVSAASDQDPGVGELKSVTAVLDPEPLLSPALLALARWVSSYYLAPPGEVARSMLPPGLLARKTLQVEKQRSWPARLRLAVVEYGSGEPTLTPRQQEVLDSLRDQGLPVPVAPFVQQARTSVELLQTLERKGWLRLAEIEVERSPWSEPAASVTPHRLTADQESVLTGIMQLLGEEAFRTLLLHGVTGSGKTEIYLNAIRATLEAGRSALLLVPEIGLTPQVTRWFRGWFGDQVAILHSVLSAGERFDQWRRIRAGACRVVVGTRSAVFAPLERLGLIIVDEEHDESYKQEEAPRYHARDTAIVRARLEDALVVLGSATPQLESYYSATEAGRFGHLELASRILERPLPTVHVVDMRREFQRTGREPVLSDLLKEFLSRTLERGQQALVLLNRRGYSRAVLCRSCGHTESCENCSITLTHHLGTDRLLCHYCGYARSIPEKCRRCEREYVFFVGMGTERVQEHLRVECPEAAIDRLDRDSVSRKGSLRRILRRFRRGETDVLVGTQMIAKGHDFPRVTMVGVLSADQGLHMADFRSAERTFQLLTQVAGRAGRGESPGDVVIQTYYPDHYSLKYACTQDYGSFYGREIEFRKRFRYPPFTALANLVISGPERDEVAERAARLAERLKEERARCSDLSKMRILGPAPAPIERLKRDYRYQILVKSTDRPALHAVLEPLVASSHRGEAGRVQVDIDPVRLL